MAQLNVRIPDELLARLDASKPEYLDRKGFLCQILDERLDSAATLGLASGSEASPSKAVITSNTNTLKTKYIYPNLEKHEELITEFWRVKKGSKSEQGWKLLMTELTKLQERYGDAVVEEQLQLGINGLWKGISMRLYEQFKAPRGNTPTQPEQNNHPASRVYTAKDFELPNPNNPLTELI